MSQVAALSSAGTITAIEDALNIDDASIVGAPLPYYLLRPHSAGSRSAVCTF